MSFIDNQLTKGSVKIKLHNTRNEISIEPGVASHEDVVARDEDAVVASNDYDVISESGYPFLA